MVLKKKVSPFLQQNRKKIYTKDYTTKSASIQILYRTSKLMERGQKYVHICKRMHFYVL